MLLFVQLFFITIFSYLLVKQVIKHAHDLELLDVPNERSHHCNIIPSGGGIGFVAALFSGVFIFEFSLFFQYWYLFLSILIVFAMGVYDEAKPLSLDFLGMHGHPSANYAIQEADCIIAIGCRFDDRTTGNIDKYAPEARKNQGNASRSI